jgi:transposase
MDTLRIPLEIRDVRVEKFDPKRYECPYCEGKPTTTQKTTWHDRRSHDTVAYERHVLPGLINSQGCSILCLIFFNITPIIE